MVSTGIQVFILSALLILPLYYTAGLDLQKFNLTFLLAPMSPPAAPPAPLTSKAAPRAVRNAPMRTNVPGKLIAPSFIPKSVVATPGDAAPPDEALIGVPGGIPGGQVGGMLGGVLGGIARGNPIPALGPPVAEGPREPVRVGGTVKPPRLIYGPEPDYPALARQSRTSGVVVIEAIIDENGNVTGMHLVTGHALLVKAAMDAVSKRRYEPTILDGQPTPIDLRVEITFHFS